jgi:hypothetical protein
MDTAHGSHRHGLSPDRRHQWVLFVISRKPEPGADPNVRNFSFQRERSLWKERLGGRKARRRHGDPPLGRDTMVAGHEPEPRGGVQRA